MTRPFVSAAFLSWAVLLAGGGSAQAGGQGTAVQPLTLDQAVQYATDHFPAIKAALERANSSAAGVDVARAAYLPRLDALWQSLRGTTNNVFGQVLPQSVIPALTGPVLPEASGGSVWSSAAGALLTWEPVDFGLRRATTDAAEAAVARARAEQVLTRLEVQQGVAQAFLAVVGAQRVVTAARADLDRRGVLLTAIRTLVDNQLRPGADGSRAEAERAGAAVRVAQSEQTLAIAQAGLRRALGGPVGPLTIAGDRLVASLPPDDIPPASAVGHPLALVEQAAVAQARTSEQIIAHTNLPRIVLGSSVFGRGSGASPNGTLDGGADGLRLQRGNWSAGVQVVVPNLFGFSERGARKAAAAASERASAAEYDDALLVITGEQETAGAALRGARAVAANTPALLAAARETELRARARYDAGLASIVEVADAQTLLAQAEVQDELARIDVWRALLAVAVARGGLAPFLALARQP
jgi:outer membrane protein